MDINNFIFLFLTIFMLHNLEEIFMIERWFDRTYPRIKQSLPSFVRRILEQNKTMTAARFAAVVFILSIPASALLFTSVITEQYYLFLGLNIFFALNIFTHPLQSLLLKCYVPGLWTSILLIIPYNIVLFYCLYSKGILVSNLNIGTLIIFILIIPVFLLSHKIAEKWV